MAPSEYARKLKALRERAGLSTRDLGTLAGWGHTRVQYWEAREKTDYLPQRVVEAFAPHLVGKGSPPIQAAEVFGLAGMAAPAQPTAELPPSNISPVIDDTIPLPLRSESPRDIPVLGISLGGEGGEFTMNGEVADYARRPPALAHRKDVFAVWVEGESMKPWRQPRELVFVERNRRPVVGDHVIIELKGNGVDEVRPAYVKRLVAVTSTKVRVAQYNPEKEIEYDRAKVHRLYRVMEWPEVLGVNV